MQRPHSVILPAALCLLAPLGCSLLINLDDLTAAPGATSGGGGESNAGPGGPGGAGGAGTGTGGTIVPGSQVFTDDELAGEFGSGTFDGTAWAGDRVALAAGASAGEFRSRVLDATATASWQTLSWRPLAPYGKALPDQGESESGYAEGNIDMTGNVLLLHMEGPAPTAVGQPIPDTSGRGNDVTVRSKDDALPTVSPGRFGQALEDRLTTWLAAKISPDSDFQFQESDLTWALWVKTTQSCAGNKVHLGAENSGGTHLWLGCAPETYAFCPPGATGGRAGGYFTAVQSSDDGGGFCGKRVINDGAWHHVALTRTGHPTSTMRLYVDGALDAEVTLDFIEPFTFELGTELAIGAFSTGTFAAEGAFDEVAIWKRALDDQEIAALHRRGALRLGLQVRTCPDAECSAAGVGGFTGPGMLEAAWFQDPTAALEPGAVLSLTGLPAAQFFQYRVLLESDIPTLSPGLSAVTVTAEPQ